MPLKHLVKMTHQVAISLVLRWFSFYFVLFIAMITWCMWMESRCGMLALVKGSLNIQSTKRGPGRWIFSLADPMMFASGSDDCSVRLWSINEVCFLLYCAHSICGPKLYCSCLALSSIISTNAKLQQLTKSTF